MTYTFEPVTLAHSSICAALDGLCFNSEVFSEDMLTSFLKTPYVFGYLLLDDNQPIGYSLISVAGPEGDLLTIGVIPEVRGKGLGQKLLEKTMHLAHEKGIETIFLEVRPSNASAIALYKKMGGSQVGLRRNYYMDETTGKCEDALVMSMPVS